MKIAILSQEPFDYESFSATSLRAKAHGMAERGHEVWVLAPGSQESMIRAVPGVSVLELPLAPSFLSKESSTGHSSWMSALVGELVRCHREQCLDIVDVPNDLTGICQMLVNAMGTDRRPALVQIGGKLSERDGLTDPRTNCYHLDGELVFTAANPIESHIAILRLENFFHGVLNRHYEAHRPAA